MNTHYYFFMDDNIEKRLFDSEYLTHQNSTSKLVSAGRGKIIYFEYAGMPLVLRHYRRGGLPAKISDDKYLWLGKSLSRPWREYQLLKWMQTRELPAPRPFAAHIKRQGLLYSADLITHRIENSHTMGELLQSQILGDDVLARIGATVRKFHDEGVDHTDLNANNILLTENRHVFLIDFDHCRIRAQANENWKQDNLLRLQRSLIKLRKNLERFYFTAENWRTLRRGYERG